MAEVNGIPSNGELARRMSAQDTALKALQADVGEIKTTVAVIAAKLDDDEQRRQVRVSWGTTTVVAMAALLSAIIGALIAVLIR